MVYDILPKSHLGRIINNILITNLKSKLLKKKKKKREERGILLVQTMKNVSLKQDNQYPTKFGCSTQTTTVVNTKGKI